MLPFSTVENKDFKTHVKHESISLSTFTRYLTALTNAAETKISKQLLVNFALVFDGWTSYSSHNIALYSSFPANNRKEFICRLLSVSPMRDECQFDSDQHIEYFNYVLSLCEKSMNYLFSLVSDNASVNKSISDKTGIPFIGCSSYRFNLAVHDILEHDEILISKVHSIIVKLRTLLLSAKLQKLSQLRPYLR